MSIFSKIKDAIFGKKAEAATPATVTPVAPAEVPAGPAAAAAPTAPISEVDVEAILAAEAAKVTQPLNWRTSIVDLMKLLDLDSSLTARKQLADELHYTGDKDDSATMNVWLHKALMKALADNGGKVPAELLD